MMYATGWCACAVAMAVRCRVSGCPTPSRAAAAIEICAQTVTLACSVVLARGVCVIEIVSVGPISCGASPADHAVPGDTVISQCSSQTSWNNPDSPMMTENDTLSGERLLHFGSIDGVTPSETGTIVL